jgi:hypothetical protein
MIGPMSDCLTDAHLILFGRIVQSFARYEALIAKIMASVSGADVTALKLLTGDMTIGEKRQALLRLLRHRDVPLDQIDAIQKHLDVVLTFAPLRNDIGHSLWVASAPEETISPAWLSHAGLSAIKPVHDVPPVSETAGGGKDFIEGYDDKVTYTLDDLKEAAESLQANIRAFEAYAAEIELIS